MSVPTYPLELDFAELSITSDALEVVIERSKRRIANTYAKPRTVNSTRSRNIRTDAGNKLAKAERALLKVSRCMVEHHDAIVASLKGDAR